MRAIFKREFQACFQSVIGWLFLSVTLAFYFLYYYVYNLNYGYPYISYSLNAIAFIFLVTVPVLTMRVLAEERHAKTDQLILTAPVSVGKIVTGKYLALAAVYSIAVALISLSPLFLGRFGSVPYAESYAAILGFWLYGLTCIAVGTFVSSLTESQVIAAVLTFVLLFLGYMMDGITQMISSAGNLLTRLLGCYNLTAGMERLTNGQLDITAVIYYLSMIVLFLFLTTQSIQKRRWSASLKKMGIGIFNAGFCIAAAAAVVILNLTVDVLPATLTNIDCTAAKLYSVTDDTKRILSALNQQVDLYVLASESSRDEQLAATLQKYEELSSNIQVTYVDPAVSPNFYQKYTQDQISQNSLIAVCGERSKVIDYSNIYEMEVDYQTYSSKTTGYDAEGQLTSAIQYVTNEDMPTVYTVTGHGEISVSTRFKELIEKMNLGLKELNLLETDAVPQDCKALMILGPSTDFSKDDADKVRNYLADGGKALITTQYTTDAMQNFKSILEAYGLQLNNGMVIEQNQERYYQNPMYLLPEISYDTLTEKVANEYIFAPYAQGLTIQEQEQDVRSYTELLTTSEQAFLKSDVQNMTNFDKEEGDLQGPFTIGVSVIDSQSEAQLLVYTSAMLFSDSADQQVSGNNSTLFASSIRSLAAQSESSSLIVIPVKPYTQESLVLSQGTILTAGFFSVLAIPVLLIAVGVLIWMRRRKA